MRRSKNVWLFVVLLLVSQMLKAEGVGKGAIEGVAVDAGGAAVPNALIKLAPLPITVVADGQARSAFQMCPPASTRSLSPTSASLR
jgi:hypothetical protein